MGEELELVLAVEGEERSRLIGRCQGGSKPPVSEGALQKGLARHARACQLLLLRKGQERKCPLEMAREDPLP
jgi:hypothetical protein